MPDLKDLQLQKESLSTIGDFFSAYQKLTIYQMQKNRSATVNSRPFSQGLIDTFIEVKQSIRKLFEKENKEHISFSTLEKNGKSVAVFLSFETKFSTDLIRKSFQHFAKTVRSNRANVSIILTGSVAKRLFSEYFPNDTEYEYYDMTEKNAHIANNIELLRRILQFERVEVYYPYFVSIMHQEPQSDTISGDIPLGDTLLQVEKEKHRYFFEPDKKQILRFFEIQILGSILQQKIREAQLATLGARITTLQYTQQNIDTEMSKIRAKTLKTLRKKESKKQRNRLAGMNFWR